jgi:hypothetical protein
LLGLSKRTSTLAKLSRFTKRIKTFLSRMEKGRWKF